MSYERSLTIQYNSLYLIQIICSNVCDIYKCMMHCRALPASAQADHAWNLPRCTNSWKVDFPESSCNLYMTSRPRVAATTSGTILGFESVWTYKHSLVVLTLLCIQASLALFPWWDGVEWQQVWKKAKVWTFHIQGHIKYLSEYLVNLVNSDCYLISSWYLFKYFPFALRHFLPELPGL